MTDDVPANEVDVLLDIFVDYLRAVSGDGSVKRRRGEKPPWWKDGSHEAAIFSHLNKWKHGEMRDNDSGQHPLVHLAWRALAIAYQEINGKVSPYNAGSKRKKESIQERSEDWNADEARGKWYYYPVPGHIEFKEP